MTPLRLCGVDYLILGIYLLSLVVIGYLLRSAARTGRGFLLSHRSIPAWMAGLAFLSANLGAQEVIGMNASGAKYGLLTCHFYWLGAIPAMVFLGFYMMPFYYGSGIRSVPEYLKRRFDERTRALNALTFGLMTLLSSGASMWALARLLETILGWNLHISLLVSALMVWLYIGLGGLTSAIYTEVMQFFLMVLGFFPLTLLGLWHVGGWDGLCRKFQSSQVSFLYGSSWTHTWRNLGDVHQNPMGIEWIGMVAGLGFVLSFGYWCTDFQVIQRAMAAHSMLAARKTPMIAAFPKMLFPFLVVLPGMIAMALSAGGSAGGFAIPATAVGGPDYNMALPSLMSYFLPNGLLGLAITALVASFMSGMAGNVTAFNSVWTFDVYQSYINPDPSDAQILATGRWATVGGLLASLGAAYLVSTFDNIMDFMQLTASFVHAPLLATFLLGMFWARTNSRGAFWGLCGGILAATLHHGLTRPQWSDCWLKGGWLYPAHHYASEMAQGFWTAIWAFGTCLMVTWMLSMLFPRDKSDQELVGLVYSLTPRSGEPSGRLWLWAALVLGATLGLNLYFW